jgi:hypothetical protein
MCKRGGRSCPHSRFTGSLATTHNAKKFSAPRGDRRNAPRKYATGAALPHAEGMLEIEDLSNGRSAK